MPIPYAVTIDTEEEWDWDGGWPTDNLALSNIQLLPRFQEICSRYGVAATYFVDHAVLSDGAARDVIQRLSEHPKVEIGMHIHPWNTPPIAEDQPVRSRDTFLENLSAELIQEKLQTVWDQFTDCHLRPTSFRGGRYSSGSTAQDFLQARRFVADASVCPYSNWIDNGAPDYRARGLEPRRLPPRTPDEKALWEIPLTLAFTRRPHRLWQKWYEFVEQSWLSKLHLIGIGERLNVVRKVWLNFETPMGRHMVQLAELLRRRQTPFLCFTLHSSSLMPGGNSFTRTHTDADRIFAQLESIFDWLSRSPEYYPATISEVADHLEKEHHASHRN